MNQTSQDINYEKLSAAPQHRLPVNPKRAVQEMMNIISDLQSIYELETEALETSNVKTFMALQNDKIETAAKYQGAMAQMMERKDEIKQTEPELRRNLQAMQKKFHAIASRNKTCLDKLQRGIGRLHDTLQTAAKEAIKKDKTFSYTEMGAMNTEGIKRITTGTISETA